MTNRLDRRGFFAWAGAAIGGVFAAWRSQPIGEYDIKFDGDPPHGIALQLLDDNAEWITIEPIDADGGFLVPYPYQKYLEDAVRQFRIPPELIGDGYVR